MPCLLVVFCCLMPRLTMVFIALLTSWFSEAFETWYWPLLGWLCMPYTTLAYMVVMLNGGMFTGGWILLMAIAIAVDLLADLVHAIGKD